MDNMNNFQKILEQLLDETDYSSLSGTVGKKTKDKVLQGFFGKKKEPTINKKDRYKGLDKNKSKLKQIARSGGDNKLKNIDRSKDEIRKRIAQKRELIRLAANKKVA